MFDLKQLQKMQHEIQERMSKMDEELEKKVIEATSGGGVIAVKMNGKQQILSIKIQPEAVDPDDIEMLEDLVLAAVNAAITKSKELSQNNLTQLTGGMKIPGLPF
ncbi:MAG TPA: YbaB/EbfC family nucleoid-associated protein [Candidatus Sumerlaeota bacterium]|nr:MAG: Nucleoid-associated protein [candidate division BRC1 bacterium ADurb.Bin183]HOE63976.1 YbaB/EbfC family nucleoid-associated protein [Candidatus Sumerlaeota bacterium]HRR30627.1 YbaB/EbfC family nucleoid-associated protein [Candidatus Sumerlaeia bacterium]HON50802.1 YbaB/EbfC family nucleoid-associated protein [Candidatus Sumerlaeota bacterium]HOR65496.1 YbaB/EbfC family nucleoid-associated protein [Candidatus Sumerlaeota bacterium]